MSHISCSELRRNMAHYLDKIADDREPLIVTRAGGTEAVVIMSEAEFTGWQETVHLLSSPKNAERLLISVREARAGRARERQHLGPRSPSKPE